MCPTGTVDAFPPASAPGGTNPTQLGQIHREWGRPDQHTRPELDEVVADSFVALIVHAGHSRHDRSVWFKKPADSVSSECAPSRVDDAQVRPPVPLTWLQTPTIAEANVMSPLAGTSFYQPAIRRVVQHVEAASPTSEMFTIQLAVLPEGPYAGSVAVYADGRRVATIPKSWPADYRAAIGDLARDGRPATCRAVLAGHRDGREAIGIWALLWNNRVSPLGEGPVLPQLIGTRVEVLDHVLADLDASIRSKARKITDRRVGHVDPASREVRIAGRLIGTLADPNSDVVNAVAAAARAGLETTCGLRLVREQGRMLRVVADLPH